MEKSHLDDLNTGVIGQISNVECLRLKYTAEKSSFSRTKMRLQFRERNTLNPKYGVFYYYCVNWKYMKQKFQFYVAKYQIGSGKFESFLLKFVGRNPIPSLVLTQKCKHLGLSICNIYFFVR